LIVRLTASSASVAPEVVNRARSVASVSVSGFEHVVKLVITSQSIFASILDM
jgi:hypothetical protein